MIDVIESKNQNIVIIKSNEKSEINVENVKDQVVKVSGETEIEEIPVVNSFPMQKITVGIPENTNSDYEIALDSKVPKALSVLSPIVEGQFNTLNARQNSRVYIDINNQPRYATIEQIKSLNTKVLFVDGLNDNRIYSLSSEDIILLKED